MNVILNEVKDLSASQEILR